MKIEKIEETISSTEDNTESPTIHNDVEDTNDLAISTNNEREQSATITTSTHNGVSHTETVPVENNTYTEIDSTSNQVNTTNEQYTASEPHISNEQNDTENVFFSASSQYNVQRQIIGDEDIECNPTRICIMGIGGGGVNAINELAHYNVTGVNLVAANTDTQSLYNSHPSIAALPLGKKSLGGLGTGGNPLIGAKAAEISKEHIYKYLKNFDMVFIATGLGGGTGTGAAPIIAEIARDLGVLSLGIVTVPFEKEGSERIDNAKIGLQELEEVVDALIVIPNDNITSGSYATYEMNTTDGFEIVDQVLAQTVQGMVDMITIPGKINIDFADIKSCLQQAGHIAVLFGSADGNDKKSGQAEKAIEDAFNNTIISKENYGVCSKANNIIVNTVVGRDVSMQEYQTIFNMVTERIASTDNICFKHGYREEKSWEKKIQVSIIASSKSSQDSPNQNVSSRASQRVSDNMSATSSQSNAKHVLGASADYVDQDMFKKLMERNNSSSISEPFSDENYLDESTEYDRYNVPAVNRLLRITPQNEEIS